MEVDELRAGIRGKVIELTNREYESVRRGLIWNQLTPTRYPRMIVQAVDSQDVIRAVRFARDHGIKVSVRGGGHSWVAFSLRDDSLLIDLGQLKNLSVDPLVSNVLVQPSVTGRELNRELSAHGLAFPIGHCSSVALSGYLLNGGLGWNSNTWGPACFSIEAATVVTAEGNQITASADENSDLLWAIRGGGPGFFGVVTQYRLKTYPGPRCIRASSYIYPLQRVEDVGAWAAEAAQRLPRAVELTFFIAPAPPDIADQCRSENGFVAILSAVAFVDTEREAIAALGPLENCPFVDDCLMKDLNQPTSFDALLDLGASLWPESHRCLADTVWYEAPANQILRTTREHFLQAPSPKSLAVCVFRTGSVEDQPILPDAAFSLSAARILLCYAIWEQHEADEANAVWHREIIAALDKFAVGHYVGESDIVAQPERAQRSYAPANWERLQTVRKAYDPNGLFHANFTVSN